MNRGRGRLIHEEGGPILEEDAKRLSTVQPVAEQRTAASLITDEEDFDIHPDRPPHRKHWQGSAKKRIFPKPEII